MNLKRCPNIYNEYRMSYKHAFAQYNCNWKWVDTNEFPSSVSNMCCTFEEGELPSL